MNRIMLSWLIVLALTVRAQDTTRIFTIDEFYRQISLNHPVVRQAGLLDEQARQEIRMARGNFDPKLEAHAGTKKFQDKSYYQTFEGQLSLPTRSPVIGKFGYERTTGDLLDPSEKIPGGRQAMAGIVLPLGRGLLTDDRRTILKQAELMTDMLAADQTRIINKFLLEAAIAYWMWNYHYQSMEISRRALALADDIQRRVNINFIQGESSVLDTIQASINRQTRWLEATEAELEFRNAGLELSNYLWNEQLEPLTLSPDMRPLWSEPDGGYDLPRLLDQARTNHPDLIRLRTRLAQLQYERRLAVEYLKPRLDLNYSLLSQPGAPRAIDFRNDYKIAMDFSFPLFLRKERAKVKLTDLRITHNELEASRQERDILLSLEQSFNEIVTTKALQARQRTVIGQYERLVQGELLNLQQGESDLFRINQQQDKLLQASIKGAKLDAEIQKLFAYLWWSAGSSPLTRFSAP